MHNLHRTSNYTLLSRHNSQSISHLVIRYKGTFVYDITLNQPISVAHQRALEVTLKPTDAKKKGRQTFPPSAFNINTPFCGFSQSSPFNPYTDPHLSSMAKQTNTPSQNKGKEEQKDPQSASQEGQPIAKEDQSAVKEDQPIFKEDQPIFKEDQPIFKEIKEEDKIVYEFSSQIIPYIFHFREDLLKNSRLSLADAIKNPIASKLVESLKKRILPKRKTSRTGMRPTRMKYEEKVKFIMRGVEDYVAKVEGRPAQKLLKFNLVAQQKFFAAPSARKYYFEAMNKVLADKQHYAQRKRQQLQVSLKMFLQLTQTDPEVAKAKAVQLKAVQLPWTQEMFEDIKEFIKYIYAKYMGPNRRNKLSRKTAKFPEFEQLQKQLEMIQRQVEECLEHAKRRAEEKSSSSEEEEDFGPHQTQ